MASVQQHGPVQLVLAPAAAGFRPGETVTALLQASTSQPDGVELQEVEIHVTGLERVDSSWVSPAYRKDAPAVNSDRRKVQRLVIHSRLQAATQGAFSDSSLRRFIIRFALPNWLPPTFRGTAVRYSYTLQASVTYRELDVGELAAAELPLPSGELMPEDLPQDNAADSEDEAATGAAGQQHAGDGSRRPPLPPGSRPSGAAALRPAAAEAATTSVTVRIPLLIWPLRPEGPPAVLGGQANGLGRPTAGLAAQQQHSDEVSIKCWEIGPGTAVQDAIAHIAKLAAVPAALRPSSPGRVASRLQQHVVAQQAVPPPPLPPQQQPAERGSAAIEAGSTPADGAAAAAGSPTGSPQAEQQPAPAAAAPPAGPPVALRRPSMSLARAFTSESERALTPSTSLALEGSNSAVRSYALRIGEQPLARVSLHPPLEGALQPGATVGVTLDFAHAAAAAAVATTPRAGGGGESDAASPPAPPPRCMHVLVLLETEEVVEEPWRPKGAAGIRRVWEEHSEVTADAACSHFLFTVPPDAAPSFQVPLVGLRWLLRFQFTARTPREGAGASPLKGAIEQLSWTLPLTVVSPRA
eukprot:scaffold6.g2645.t1